MKYMIVKAKSHYELEQNVEKWLLLGYKPQGGVSVRGGSMRDDFYQAMVRDD